MKRSEKNNASDKNGNFLDPFDATSRNKQFYRHKTPPILFFLGGPPPKKNNIGGVLCPRGDKNFTDRGF